jgi:AraC-like DNA-binding protein
MLQGEKFCLLDSLKLKEISEELSLFFKKRLNYQKAGYLIEEIFFSLFGDQAEPEKKDPRMFDLLKYLNESNEVKIPIKILAERINLSESRFIHVFTKQIGIPVRRYFLWRKLINAVRQIINGMDFTQAAHDAGFSDSAHLSRTFKKMFGITMMNLFKNYNNSQFVQVIIHESHYI